MVDLMKLEGVMRDGQVISDNGKSIVAELPVFVMSFPRLSEAKPYKGGKPKFRHRMIWNPSRDDIPARVDLDKIIIPCIEKVAAANGFSLRVKDSNPILEGVKYDSEGEPIAGYEEWCRHATASKVQKRETTRVQCFSATAKPIDPSELYGGCYCRSRVEIYGMTDHKKVCFTPQWIQMVDPGTPFSGEDVEYDAPGAIPGATDVAPPAHEDFG